MVWTSLIKHYILESLFCGFSYWTGLIGWLDWIGFVFGLDRGVLLLVTFHVVCSPRRMMSVKLCTALALGLFLYPDCPLARVLHRIYLCTLCRFLPVIFPSGISPAISSQNIHRNIFPQRFPPMSSAFRLPIFRFPYSHPVRLMIAKRGVVLLAFGVW